MKRQPKTFTQAEILRVAAGAYGDQRMVKLVDETGELTNEVAEAQKSAQGDLLMVLLAAEVASLTQPKGNTWEHLEELRRACYRLANTIETVGDAIYAIRLNSAQQSG